ncbi:MAG: tetratricopeptide repeat protein [Deltaproteobacteria bacterium]|nr:MAG: tetratricopeptide repeat protein [Deltaproteobacteria bacterium]
MDRIDTLRAFAAQRPDDPFPLYGLAMELRNAQRYDEAQEVFDRLRAAFPDYLPAYFHAGANLAALGRTEDALARYRDGLDVARRAGDAKTADEISAAIAELEAKQTE